MGTIDWQVVEGVAYVTIAFHRYLKLVTDEPSNLDSGNIDVCRRMLGQSADREGKFTCSKFVPIDSTGFFRFKVRGHIVMAAEEKVEKSETH